jgi:hypothetical protein
VARRSALREVLGDRALVGALAVLWICALFPIWIPRFLPLLDFPNHLGAMAILHRHGDPSWGYDKFYTLNLKPAPYWGHYFPVHLLAYVVPLEIANKIWISAVALVFPLGTAVLARQLDRSPWLALLVAPFVFGYCFALGFLSFCGGVALFPWALWSLEAFLDEPTAGRGVALALLSCTLYLMHVMPWAVFGIAAGVILCSHGWQPRRLGAAAGCMLVSVVLALSGMIAQGTDKWATADAGSNVTHAGRWAMRFEPFRVALVGLPERWLANLPHKLSTVILIVLLVSVIALVITSGREQAPARRYGIILVLCLVMYFVLPQALYKPLAWWYIAGRMTAFLAVLLAIAPRGPITGNRRWLLAPAALIAIVFPLELARRWHKYDQRLAGFVRLMDKVPRGSSTLVLSLGRPDDPDVDRNSVPYMELHSLAQVMAGGFDPWAQATPLGGFPMSPIPDKVLPAPYYARPQDFRMDAHGVHYDYLLTRNERKDYDLVRKDGRAMMVGDDGAFRLYQVQHEPHDP